MAKRHHDEEHENHERWLITYADVITLLMAFFVMMYAMANLDLKKFEQFKASAAAAFGGDPECAPPAPAQTAGHGSGHSSGHGSNGSGHGSGHGSNGGHGSGHGSSGGHASPGHGSSGGHASPGHGSPGGHEQPSGHGGSPASPAAAAKACGGGGGAAATAPPGKGGQVTVPRDGLGALRAELERRLAAAGLKKQVAMRVERRGLVIYVTDRVLFDSGSADVRADGLGVLRQVGSALAEITNHVIVEGHTDDVPVTGGRYGSNWELSTLRATSVVHVLIAAARLPANQIAAAGYADTRPRVRGRSDAARARNRRVEIVVTAAA